MAGSESWVPKDLHVPSARRKTFYIVLGVALQIMVTSCSTAPSNENVRQEFLQLSDGDTTMRGALIDGWPQGEWSISFSKGAVRKKGAYEKGLPKGRWSYQLQDTSLVWDWVVLSDSVSRLSLSVPSTFRIDTSAAKGSVRFVLMDDPCPTLFALIVDTTMSQVSFERIIDQEMTRSYGDYVTLSNECSILHMDSVDAIVLDIRSQLRSPNGDSFHVHFMNRRIDKASMSVIFIYCDDGGQKDVFFAEMVQSVIFRSQYFFSLLLV